MAMRRNPLANPFWLGAYFRRHPVLGFLYHILKAFRFVGRMK